MVMFKKAERKQAKLKLAITGPSGSGKTFSALRLAKGLGGKVAFIDTENGSASLYSDHFDFDVMDMAPPFTTEKYIEAINAAEKAGYSIIVIDSLTHAWAGEGGLLEQKAQLDARPGSNHWTNWGPIDKKDLALKNAFLHSTCHVIATMRSKMEYAQTEENGKKKVQKLGMAPVQRDGLSYDFSIVFDIAMNHEAEASKDRTGLFVDKFFKITEETGKTINEWLASGKGVAIEESPKNISGLGEGSSAQTHSSTSTLHRTPTANPMPKRRAELISELIRTQKARMWEPREVTEAIASKFKKNSTKELTDDEVIDLIGIIDSDEKDVPNFDNFNG